MGQKLPAFERLSDDGTRLGAIFHECCANYVTDPSPNSEWGLQNTLSLLSVGNPACGCMARSVDALPTPHAHCEEEVARARALAEEVGGMLQGVYVFQGDESDHVLRPVWWAVRERGAGEAAPAAAAAPGPLGEDDVRALFGGALDPRYPLRLRPFPPDSFDAFRRDVLRVDDSMLESEPSWVADGGGDGAASLLGWRAAFAWFTSDPSLQPGSATYVIMHEPRWAPPGGDIERPMGCVFPVLFLARALTGSVVGVAAAVVHT